MIDLGHELAGRSRLAAYVLGNGIEYRLLWLHVQTEDAVIKECLRRGFTRCGVIGLNKAGIQMVSRFGAESLMERAREDFELGVMQIELA